MAEIPSIDLHPDKIGGSGPESALLAARQFIETALRRGHRRVRLITGLGIHGDGTPRLRGRVEREVLSAFFSRIESQHYEQSGAVIVLELKAGGAQPGKRYERQSEDEKKHQAFVRREERLMVALERFEAAEAYFEEGDLRRCRLKLNQLAREFFPSLGQFENNEEALEKAMRVIKKELNSLE